MPLLHCKILLCTLMLWVAIPIGIATILISMVSTPACPRPNLKPSVSVLEPKQTLVFREILQSDGTVEQCQAAEITTRLEGPERCVEVMKDVMWARVSKDNQPTTQGHFQTLTWQWPERRMEGTSVTVDSLLSP